MRLSINAGYFLQRPENEEEKELKWAIDMVNSAGFKLVDLSDYKLTEDGAKEICEYLKSKGMKANQAHAPFTRYEKRSYGDFADELMNAIKCTYALGAKIMVVHGDEFDFENMGYSKKAVLDFNYKLFYPVVEYAAAHGIKVAFETLFEDDPTRPRFCSETEDLIELVEKYNAENVGICWDFGHAYVQHGENHIDKIKLAGSRIISTHVHDNHAGIDMHLFPFLGKIRWGDVMETMKEIGYAGDWTLEFAYGKIPECLLAETLKLLNKSGEYMIDNMR